MIKFEPSQTSIEYIKVTVEDTGVGMSKEDQKSLFKMYGKLKDSNRLNPKGIGLGLNISNEIAKLLGNNANGI